MLQRDILPMDEFRIRVTTLLATHTEERILGRSLLNQDLLDSSTQLGAVGEWNHFYDMTEDIYRYYFSRGSR
jgi:hypothetical protein